jgi:hypothetical protein
MSMTMQEILTSLRDHEAALREQLQLLQGAIRALEDPEPEPTPKPAEEQIKDSILRIIGKHGTKTHYQLARALGLPVIRTRNIADSMVKGGALQSTRINTTTHYMVLKESLRISAGNGVL